LRPANRDPEEALMPPNHEPTVPYEQVARCLKYIQSWREHLAHAWVDYAAGAPDMRAIGNAVDKLISLALRTVRPHLAPGPV